MIGMVSVLGVVDAEVGTPDGYLMVRINDAWYLASEVDWVQST